MSITQAAILSTVGYQYKYALTIKKNETYKAIQYVCDDIAGEFDKFRGLQDSTANIALTTNTSFVDISTYLTTQRHNRIEKVMLINSANHDDDKPLTERDYLSEYLCLLADPTNPSAAADYDLPIIYSRYVDNMYFYPIPDLTTLAVKIYFDKVHPTISASQDILYPADFEETIKQGVLARLLDDATRKDGLANDRWQKYIEMKADKLLQYGIKPNLKRRIRTNW